MACWLLGSSLSLSRSRYLLLVRNSVISLLLLLGNHRSILCLHMPSGLLFTALFVPRVGLGPGGGFQRIGSPALWGQYRSLVVGTQPKARVEEQDEELLGRTLHQARCVYSKIVASCNTLLYLRCPLRDEGPGLQNTKFHRETCVL